MYVRSPLIVDLNIEMKIHKCISKADSAAPQGRAGRSRAGRCGAGRGGVGRGRAGKG